MLETPIGDIPVYNNVREGLDAGHRFNCGVVYLPPSAARDGVAELIRVNPELQQDLHHHREDRRCTTRARSARWASRTASTSSAPTASAWPIRGTRCASAARSAATIPDEALQQGLDRDLLQLRRLHDHDRAVSAHGGLGHDDADLQRQGRLHPLRRAGVRLRARQRRAQQGRGAVLRAGRLLRARRRLHQAGGGLRGRPLEEPSSRARSAMPARWRAAATTPQAKERWFMEKFGVDGIFTPDDPVFSAKGAVVTNIAHIPAALTAVMRANATLPDFAPEGSLALKPWFGSDQGLDAAAATRAAGGRGAAALRRADRAAQPADRRRRAAPDDEGRVGRLADGSRRRR